MSITIYASDKTTLKYTLKAMQTSRLHQSLNGECTLDFTMPGQYIPNIAVGDEVRLGDLYFNVVRVSKQTLTGVGVSIGVSCEHISYALADTLQTTAHFSGTVSAVLSQILSGTGFTVGTVDISGTYSVTINNDTNKRSALQEWAAVTGAEIDYTGRAINFRARIGSSTPVSLSGTENVASLSVTLDSRSDTQSYDITLSRLQRLSLGDAVTIKYSSLNLNTETRVISLDYDPFHPWTINMVTGNFIPNFTGAVSSALEARLKEGQPYYGVTIDRENGIKIERSDGLSEALFNSDVFTMRALIDGVMKDRIYFDPIKGDYVFEGALGADAVFTDSLYAELGFVAELTVDRLTTSRRVRKYLLQDTSDDNYIQIQDHYQKFITGSVISADVLDTEAGQHILTQNSLYMAVEPPNDSYLVVQVTNRYGQRLYWQREIVSVTADGYPLDANNRQIYATTETTDWPVLSYAYAEQTKAEIAFEPDGQYYVPKIVLGAGDGHGNSRGYIYKRQTDLLMRYVTTNGKNVDIQFSDEGYVDALHRRLSYLHIDRDQYGTGGTIYYKVEGNNTMHTLEFVEIDGVIRYTWPDGHVCEVSVE